MPSMSDTLLEAERVQVRLIQQMTTERRAALASSMRNRTYWMARRAIAEAYPALDEQEQKLLFISMNYGDDLARRVREHWRRTGVHG